MASFSRSSLSRRNFMAALALGTGSLLLKDYVAPASAIADSYNPINAIEIYHIFVPYTTARMGGQTDLTLRSGDSLSLKVPSRAQDSQEVIVKGKGQNGKDLLVVLHTLYDRQIRIADQVYQEIDSTQFIESASKVKCKAVYEQVEDGEYISDLVSLDLLDYVIGTSTKIDPKAQAVYQLASTSSRLSGIEQTIEQSLSSSSLNGNAKKLLRGTFACVRAGEPVPDFKALLDLDAIVTSSTLPTAIKQTYSLASSRSRALTVDFILVRLIQDTRKLTPEQKENYLLAYKQVRGGLEVTDESVVSALDKFIEKSNIPANAKVVYAFARKQNFKPEGNTPEYIAAKVSDFIQSANDVRNELQKAQKRGSALVPQTTRLLSIAQAETSTGVRISSLSGTAATNATLAFLGGGSTATGGLGMLGGLTVATGGAALIGAAGLLAIALVSDMDTTDQANLGIAIGGGTLAGAASVLAAWTAASALGVTETLSGAAAITATLSALGGLSVVTGGAALVAYGTGFLIWSILKSGKKREQGILKQLETRIYTPTEEPPSQSLGTFLKDNLHNKFSSRPSFAAPFIPLDKLSNSLSSWLSVRSNETVLALMDTSYWKDGKEGLAFTQERIIWKDVSLTYQEISNILKQETGQMLIDQQHSVNLFKLINLAYVVSDAQEHDRWVALLEEVGQKYSAV